MRPGQKNRMRGGRGGNRRGPNPLTRSYESNGPDVKVRGTPQHIAEKYVQLARDAHSSGDTVMAESYLQHAEHYYRIIAAAMTLQQQAYNQAMGVATPAGADDNQDDEDEFEVAGADRFTFRTPQSFQPGGQPGANGNGNGNYPGQPYPPGPYGEGGDQPIVEGMPQPEGGPAPYQQGAPGQGGQHPRGERPFGQRRPFEDRGNRRFGRDRDRDRDRGDRPQGEARNPEFRNPEGRVNEPRSFEPRGEAPQRDLAEVEQPGLPAFITAPAPRMVPSDEEPVAAPSDTGEGEGRVRARRRRRPRAAGGETAAEAEDVS
jgi:Domain of unknown function (DUF4167)